MNRLILRIYDIFRRHRAVAWSICIVLTATLAYLLSTLTYKEDISDFLPLDAENQTALSVYQDISGANRIFAIVSTRDTVTPDPDKLVAGVEAFTESVARRDSLSFISHVMKEIDMDKMLGIADAVYEDIPCFLTENDYVRMDSLLAVPGYVESRMAANREMLLFPSSNIVAENIARDPLGLFAPVMERLGRGGMQIDFDTYDGYILSPDGKRAIVIMESRFGAHESEHNAQLTEMLEGAAAEAESLDPDLDIHVTGGPVIAAGNARRIKDDSVLAVSIAGVLILALLIYVFRNLRNMLLILISVGWGWLFAMGVIALFYDSVSVIVIGIASVILGIAVNYPLHLIDHLKGSEHPREALREIISPLVVGNVTTVGAFLCLVPLNAPALHDLGLFASLLLAGTIMFVLVFLPHLVRTRRKGSPAMHEPRLLQRISAVSVENSRPVVWCVLILTVVFGVFSFRTEFDSDMRDINYMTDAQKEDMAYFSGLASVPEGTESVYVVSSGKDAEEALRQNEVIDKEITALCSNRLAVRSNQFSSFIVSGEEQERRLERWTQFTGRHREDFTRRLDAAAKANGFSDQAFIPFKEIIDGDYGVRRPEDLDELISTVFAGNISVDEEAGRYSVVQELAVPREKVDEVKERLGQNREFGGMCFDVKSMNGAIADTLANDFNYIGAACGCIVFLFLWISLGSIELAIVSFLPMAFSWIWILGIMGMLGLKFNIVNIILATFIFGQGDDYTIFMTEGLTYELAYRKKLLASYKNSIIVSALIMFMGIGTLLVARHPALRSLGEVTVVGMLSVVLMAWLFPPLIFNFLVRKGGRLRKRSLTLKGMRRTAVAATAFAVQLTVGLVYGWLLGVGGEITEEGRRRLRQYVRAVCRFNARHLPGISVLAKLATATESGCTTALCTDSLDIYQLMTLAATMDDLVIVTDRKIKCNRYVGKLIGLCGYLRQTTDASEMSDLKSGQRIAAVDIKCETVIHDLLNAGIRIVPVAVEGFGLLLANGREYCCGGRVYIASGKMLSDAEEAQDIREHMSALRTSMRKQMATVSTLSASVLSRYLYKGREIENASRSIMKALTARAEEIEGLGECRVIAVLDEAGSGELAMLTGMMNPEATVWCTVTDSERRKVAEGCVTDFLENVKIVEAEELRSINADYTFIVREKSAMRHDYGPASPVTIFV